LGPNRQIQCKLHKTHRTLQMRITQYWVQCTCCRTELVHIIEISSVEAWLIDTNTTRHVFVDERWDQSKHWLTPARHPPGAPLAVHQLTSGVDGASRPRLRAPNLPGWMPQPMRLPKLFALMALSRGQLGSQLLQLLFEHYRAAVATDCVARR
jgi:hypothetical protein